MTFAVTFDEAVTHALGDRKYDRLMDRAFDLGKLIARAAEAALNRLLNWLIEHIHIRLPALEGYDTSAFVNIFLAVALVLAVAVVAAIALALSRRGKRTETMEGMFEEISGPGVTFGSLKATGEGYAAQGDLRMAVRYEYMALLWLLNSRNVIFLDQAKTNSQLKREIGQNAPGISAAFADAVTMFQCAWFGHKPVSAESFGAYAGVVEDIAREVGI